MSPQSKRQYRSRPIRAYPYLEDMRLPEMESSMDNKQLRLCRLRLPNAVLPGLRHQEQAEHEAHRRNGDRVDQSIAETARRLVRRRGDEGHQSAAPAIADVIWDGYRCVANPGREIFSQKRPD